MGSPSLLCHRQRCPTLWSSHTTPPFLCTSLSRMQTNACALTTKPCMTSASAPSSSPPRPMVTSTTCARPACLVYPAACASLVSSTLTSASSESISFLSLVCTSSSPASPLSPPAAPSNTVP